MPIRGGFWCSFLKIGATVFKKSSMLCSAHIKPMGPQKEQQTKLSSHGSGCLLTCRSDMLG